MIGPARAAPTGATRYTWRPTSSRRLLPPRRPRDLRPVNSSLWDSRAPPLGAAPPRLRRAALTGPCAGADAHGDFAAGERVADWTHLHRAAERPIQLVLRSIRLDQDLQSHLRNPVAARLVGTRSSSALVSRSPSTPSCVCRAEAVAIVRQPASAVSSSSSGLV